MDRVRSEFYKQLNGVTIRVRIFEDGKIQCWAEPPIIDAKKHLEQILRKYEIPYEASQ